MPVDPADLSSGAIHTTRLNSLPVAKQKLKEVFGFDDFRGKQQDAIMAALQGRDVFVVMPTGGGKSMCYTLPALLLPGITLVVSPLIALMENQVALARHKGIPADYLSSARTAAERQAIHRELNSDSPVLCLLYVTPELLDTAGMMDTLRGVQRRGQLSLVAIDEAHCISSWGHDFRPAYRKLSSLRRQLPGLPLMALTATAASKVRDDIVSSLHLRDPLVLISSFNRPNITYTLSYTDLDDSQDSFELVHGLLQREAERHTGGLPCAIVYTHKRQTAREVASYLTTHGMPCRAYHAGLKAEERSRVLDLWSTNAVPIVAATVAFGMGIDKPDVRVVVHFNLPKSVEGFYQESGRAGRDGQPSHSVLLYCVTDRRRMEFLLGKSDKKRHRRGKRGRRETPGGSGRADDEGADDDVGMRQFEEVVSWCLTVMCRRKQLMQHFGESFSEQQCRGTCDVCKAPKEVAQKIAEVQNVAVQHASRRYGGAASLRFVDGGAAASPLGYTGYEEEAGGEESEGSGDDNDPEDPEAAAAAAAAKRARKPGVSQSHSVLEALERAEARQYRGNPARSGRASKLLHKLERGVSLARASSSAPKGMQLGEAARRQYVQKLEAALLANTALELSDGLRVRIASDLEAEACAATSTKSVYISTLCGMQRSIAAASSLEALLSQHKLQCADVIAGKPAAGDADAKSCAGEEVAVSTGEAGARGDMLSVGVGADNDAQHSVRQGAVSTAGFQGMYVELESALQLLDQGAVCGVVDALGLLGAVDVAKDVLLACPEVCRGVKKLRKHGVADIAAAAGKVVDAWRAVCTG